MYGEKGYALVKELSQCEDNVPPYNADLANEVWNEAKILIAQIREDDNLSREESGGVLEAGSIACNWVRHTAIKRNGRCLMAYHYNRLKLLQNMRWEFGSILPPEVKSNLSSAEIDWFSRYSGYLARYMRSIGDEGVNLAVNLKPPKSLSVEVRCLVDYGTFELSDGTVLRLKKDSRHFLPRRECEELLRQGVFQHID